MGLTVDERRRLQELAGEIARDDPRLARALMGWWHTARARRRTSSRDRHLAARGGTTLGWLIAAAVAAVVVLVVVSVVLGWPVQIVVGTLAVIRGPFTSALMHVS